MTAKPAPALARPRSLALALVLALATLAVPATAGAAGRSPDRVATVPVTATAAVHSLFDADGRAQLAGAKPSPVAHVSPSAAKQLDALASRDAAAAAYTRSFGVSWDTQATSVTVTSAVATAPGTLRLGVDVEHRFHLAGTPDDGALAHESITVDPYIVSLTQADGSWTVDSFGARPDPAQPASGGPAVLIGPPSSTARPAKRTLAARRRVAAGTYYPGNAVNYGAKWWDGRNPAYTAYGNDCQNYVSQVIHAGNVAFDIWDSWSPGYAPFINVDYFNYWAFNHGPLTLLGNIYSMRGGDVVQMQWVRSSSPSPDHAMFTDAVSSSGVPLLSGHTNDRWNYPITTILNNYPNSVWWAFHPYGSTR